MKNGTHMPWVPSVSSRGRTRTYDPRVMSPMSCQLLYPASNAFANIYLNKNNVNSFHHAVSSFPQSECRIQYKCTLVMVHDRSNSSLQSIQRKCRSWNHPAPAKQLSVLLVRGDRTRTGLIQASKSYQSFSIRKIYFVSSLQLEMLPHPSPAL